MFSVGSAITGMQSSRQFAVSVCVHVILTDFSRHVLAKGKPATAELIQSEWAIILIYLFIKRAHLTERCYATFSKGCYLIGRALLLFDI